MMKVVAILRRKKKKAKAVKKGLKKWCGHKEKLQQFQGKKKTRKAKDFKKGRKIVYSVVNVKKKEVENMEMSDNAPKKNKK